MNFQRQLCYSTLLILTLSGCNPPAANADKPIVPPPETDDMTVLFSGTDLSGWDGNDSMWSVVDGVIHGETTRDNPAKDNTFLIYQDDQFADFELRLSFRVGDANNSGIQYRSTRIPGAHPFVVRGYQHEIRNTVEFPDVPGFIYDEAGTRGRLNAVGQRSVWTADGPKVLDDDVITQAEFRQLMRPDQFNDVVIIARGNRIQHFLNGRMIIDFTDQHPTKAFDKGVIALQLHAGAAMQVDFKNIRIKKL